jgi:hypothetical protein
MDRRRTAALTICLAAANSALHAQGPAPSPPSPKFTKIKAAQVLLTPLRIIDSTGAAPLEDRNILIEDGKIASITQDVPLFSSAKRST